MTAYWSPPNAVVNFLSASTKASSSSLFGAGLGSLETELWALFIWCGSQVEISNISMPSYPTEKFTFLLSDSYPWRPSLWCHRCTPVKFSRLDTAGVAMFVSLVSWSTYKDSSLASSFATCRKHIFELKHGFLFFSCRFSMFNLKLTDILLQAGFGE